MFKEGVPKRLSAPDYRASRGGRLSAAPPDAGATQKNGEVTAGPRYCQSAMPRGHAAPRVELRHFRDLVLRHLPHDVAHLGVAVVAARARGEGVYLLLEVALRHVLQPRRAELAVDAAVAGGAWRDVPDRIADAHQGRRRQVVSRGFEPQLGQ